MNRLKPLFPTLTPAQWATLERMAALHREWNAKINLISRKDIEHLEWHHYAPCVAALDFLPFWDGCRVLDAGTGGGLPGLILAVLYPKAHFALADSVGRKITVVSDIAARLALPNVTALHTRIETLPRRFDFVTGRAVASLSQFIHWAYPTLAASAAGGGKKSAATEGGIIYWQGGSLDAETAALGIAPTRILDLATRLADPHFTEKHILLYPRALLPRATRPPTIATRETSIATREASVASRETSQPTGRRL
jgi:16S rRNA (guanine527-N7)-methyltransferase